MEGIPVRTVSHHEIAPESEKAELSHKEDIEGCEFIVSENELPQEYFRSVSFIGSMFTIGASFGCGVVGFCLAAPILGFIDVDNWT